MSERPRVLVIGAGAAGCAAAWSLARSGDAVAVEVWEKAAVAGGVASTQRWKGYWFNDGVQGGAPCYANTFRLHAAAGFEPRPVHMTINFGKGPTWWNNYGEKLETDLVRRLRPEIRRFGQLLERVNRLPWLYIWVPIARLLRWHGFSKSFTNLMVLPLTALFFGTGNQTPKVSAVIVARVFLDPHMRLFAYDPDRLLSTQPLMFAFDALESIYTAMLKHPGIERVCYEREACRLEALPDGVWVTDHNQRRERFSQVILATDAQTALKLLGSGATFMERNVLGRVRYFHDVTVTHTDEAYMDRYYQMDPDRRTDMYFVRTDPVDPSCIDMSFLLSAYQEQLRDAHGEPLPLFQTIFLNKEERHRWTMDEIRRDQIVLVRWWKQMSHEWRHFVQVVPFVRFIQGGRHGNLWYAGSWTLMNIHEVAICSGLAAAEACGWALSKQTGKSPIGAYPFERDADASRFYTMYAKTAYGSRFRERLRNARRASAATVEPLQPSAPGTPMES
jgi:predicted NAD/FAD-binding protein